MKFKTSILRAVIIFTVLILYTNLCKAQSTIHGSVAFSTHAPAVNASALLLKANDTSLVKAMLCNKDGNYYFSNVADGNYMVAASFSGYNQVYSNIFTVNKKDDATVNVLTLTEQAGVLNDVTVTVKKPLLEQKIDRLVINVASSITSAGNTALEVLERSPGVIVDHQNNTISMNGKDGVVLMMNGKISHTTVAALMQLLAGMPSGNIEKIELITTPSASFDAEGNAGYINIVLKENNNIGTNGSYTATLGYNKYLITQGSMNINHRKGNVNIYGDVDYSRVKTHHTVNGTNIISNKNDITETIFEGNRVDTVPLINARLGVDVELSRHTVLGLLFSGYDNHYTQSEHNMSSIIINNILDTLIHHENKENDYWYNYAGSANLQHNFNETDKLVFNIDYIYYNNVQPVNYHSLYYNNSDNFLYDIFFRSGKNTPMHFEVASFDYSKKLTEKISVEAGAKQTVSAFNNDISFENFNQNVWVKDESLSAIYRLKEDYTAAYTSFNITINKTTQAKAGLRYEHTNSNLGTETTKNIVDRHYGNLFPSVFLTHTINDNNSIDFSYSRRITRPTFNALAPFTYYANVNTVITGNPSLQPSISDNFKAGYTYKKYLLSLTYSFEKNAISGFQPQSDSVTNKLVITPENLINQKTASVIISLPFNVTKWWSMQYNITGIWQQVNALYLGEKVSISQSNFTINASEQFTLPKNFSIEVSGYYESAMLYGLGKSRPTGSLDAGIKKKLPGKGGSITFNATDILNSSFFSAYTNLPEQNLVDGVKIYFIRPAYKLTYTRNFGKEKLKATRNYSTGAEDEKGRVQ